MINILADACDPSLPGCHHDSATHVFVIAGSVAIVVGLVLVATLIWLMLRARSRR